MDQLITKTYLKDQEEFITLKGEIILKLRTYPSCKGGYSHSCPLRNMPEGNNSQMGMEGGSVCTFAVIDKSIKTCFSGCDKR